MGWLRATAKSSIVFETFITKTPPPCHKGPQNDEYQKYEIFWATDTSESRKYVQKKYREISHIIEFQSLPPPYAKSTPIQNSKVKKQHVYGKKQGC